MRAKKNIHFDGKNAIFRHKTSFAMQLTAEQPQNSQYYSLFPSNKSYSRKEYKLACGTSAARFKKFRRKVKLLRAVNISFPSNKSYFRKEYILACVVSAAKRKLSLELSLYTFQRARLALPSAMVAVPKNVKGIYLSIKIRFKNQRKPLPNMLTKQTKRSNCPALGTNCSLFFYQSSLTSVFTSE